MVQVNLSQYMVDDAIISNSNTDMAISKRPIFPVVGIGASAGGLAAFEAFFNGTLQLLEPAEPRGHRLPIKAGIPEAGFTVQLFATDIDSRAIGTARQGLYPAGIAADISPERLARFFTAEADGSGYRIHKRVRDLLVFSEQNVIKDPPFSKLDMISCRNRLIYLGSA